MSWDKGKAAVWLRQRFGPQVLTVGIGDDQTDEDLFRGVADGISIKVGTADVSTANYQLASSAEVLEFLQWLGTVPMAEPCHRASEPYAARIPQGVLP